MDAVNLQGIWPNFPGAAVAGSGGGGLTHAMLEKIRESQRRAKRRGLRITGEDDFEVLQLTAAVADEEDFG